MYLVRKNELIYNVAKKLVDLKEKPIKENRKPIKDIVYKLNLEVDNDVWQDFEFRFIRCILIFIKSLNKGIRRFKPR